MAMARTKAPPPEPRRTSRMPARRSWSSASRTTGRETPKRAASSWSRGSREPGGIEPARMPSTSARTTRSAARGSSIGGKSAGATSGIVS